jgi:hypothetical protein
MSAAVIVRLPNWLGDTVMAVPALRAVRTHWRDARLILAGPWASLLAGQGLGDVLVDYPRAWASVRSTATSRYSFPVRWSRPWPRDTGGRAASSASPSVADHGS